MKFSDSGATALDGLRKYMKTRRKSQRTTAKPTTPEIKSSESKSWIHARIACDLEYEKSRRFPLEGGTVYCPDYILTRSYNGKRIVVQIDECPATSNAQTYRSFMKEFKNTYHVILVVCDKYLRKWNEIDMNKRVLFDEIWVAHNIGDMISSIKSRPVLGNLDAGSIICTSCYKKADGMGKIKRDFVCRVEKDGSITVLPQCKDCLSTKTNQSTSIPQSSRRCIGCGESFNITTVSQLYCNSCICKLRTKS